jgi:hypothetical protein
MAFSVNGFGTTYYGQSEFDQDGTFITTKWIILGFVPLIPTSSIRVQFADSGFFSGTSYDVIMEMPLNLAQVFKTWLYVAFLFLIFAKVMDNSKLNPGLQWTLLGAAIALPLALRFFARRAATRIVPERPVRVERPIQTLPPGEKISTCPKCTYTRTADDYAPEWQCPSCKVAYNKVTPAERSSAERASRGIY